MKQLVIPANNSSRKHIVTIKKDVSRYVGRVFLFCCEYKAKQRNCKQVTSNKSTARDVVVITGRSERQVKRQVEKKITERDTYGKRGKVRDYLFREVKTLND